MIHPPQDRVSILPLAASQRPRRDTWRVDVQAGATVAAFAVPQAMAYAVLAGLPPAHGLYAAVVMSIVAVLWGSSPYVNSGPTNSAALLTASALAPFVAALGIVPGSTSAAESVLRLVFTFTLLVGFIRVLLGLLRMGWVVRFVPAQALLGFMLAADLLIAVGQLHQLLGVDAPHAQNPLLRTVAVLADAGNTDWRALLIGLGCVALLWTFDRYARRVPVALGVIGLAAILAAALQPLSSRPLLLVRDIAPIPSGMPPFSIHPIDLSLLGAMLPGALAVAAIGLVEAVSIGQSFAIKKRQRVNFNQEFFGQGLSQLVGACFGGFPGSGSYSRSALIERNGGQTALANICFGLFTALALWLAPQVLERIPLAALAGLLLFTGIKLIDPKMVMRVWQTSRADAGVLALTFLVTLFTRIEWGFFVGIVAAMALFVARARELQLFELTPRSCGRRFDEISYTPNSVHEPSEIVALSVQGELFFALAHDLREQLGEIVREQRPRIVVVRTRRAHAIDSSCWAALFDFATDFAAQGGKLYLTGVSENLIQIVHQTGMGEILPAEQLVARTAASGQAFELGLERVREHLGADANLSTAWQSYFGSSNTTLP